MAHPNQTPWDATILVKLGTAPYAGMAQDGSADDAIAEALNAETVSAPGAHSDIQTGDIEQIVVPTMELYAITQFGGRTPSGTNPPTQEDQAIAAAWSFFRMLDKHMAIFTSRPNVWAASQAVMGGLKAAGLLSQASIDAITALVTPPLISVPWWQSIGAPGPLNRYDIERAREA